MFEMFEYDDYFIHDLYEYDLYKETAFIPEMKKSLQSRLQEYERKYNEEPFSAKTMEVGDTLLREDTEERRKEWKNTVEGLDMKTNNNKL